jgi:diaminopimelate decarboxylase
VIEAYFVRDGAFSADGVGIDEIVSVHGTPLYLYSAGVIDAKYDRLRSSFPGFEIFYSLKANPSVALCRRLRAHGARADISSLGELETALKAGFGPGEIAFVGPGKTRQALEAAIRTGIFAIVAESPHELGMIESICGSLSRPVNVLLRINTLEQPSAPEMMVGGASKFGFDEESVVDQVRGVRLERARLTGIHVYSASQVLDSGFISGHLEYVADLAVRLSRELNFGLRCVDFGGGFGVPYESGETELDLGPIARAAAGTRRKLEDISPGCRLIFEVGRYLVAESGIFITRVLRVKESRGTTFVIADGGINHFTRPVFMHVNHAIRILNKMGHAKDTRCNVGGPVCTPFDIIGQGVLLPRPEPGDIVGVFNAGAYGYTMSMTDFMSLGAPAEVLADAGRLSLIRNPKPPGHTLDGQLSD